MSNDVQNGTCMYDVWYICLATLTSRVPVTWLCRDERQTWNLCHFNDDRLGKMIRGISALLTSGMFKNIFWNLHRVAKSILTRLQFEVSSNFKQKALRSNFSEWIQLMCQICSTTYPMVISHTEYCSLGAIHYVRTLKFPDFWPTHAYTLLWRHWQQYIGVRKALRCVCTKWIDPKAYRFADMSKSTSYVRNLSILKTNW